MLSSRSLIDLQRPKAAQAPVVSGPIPEPQNRDGLPTDGLPTLPVRPLTISPRQPPSPPARTERSRLRPVSAKPSILSRSSLSLESVNHSLPPLSFSATSCTLSLDSASWQSHSSLSAHHHDCSRRSLTSPVLPPPTCPLPPIPLPDHSSLPRSDCHSPDLSSPAGLLPRTNFRASLRQSLRLTTPSPSSHHPSKLFRHTLSQLPDDLSDDDPFAAEKIFIPPGFRGAGSGWSDEELIDPLGPAPCVNRRNSLRTESASCYSVNTVIESRAKPSERNATAPPAAEHAATEQLSEEERMVTVQPCGDNASTVAARPHELSAPLKRPSMLRGCFPAHRFPATETFSYGPPRRLDGLFFGFQRRPPPKDHTGPAIVLETSPPLSTTAFEPGDPIRVRLTLASVFERIVVSFVGQARLVGETKMAKHVFLEHEIELERPGRSGCWEVARVGDEGDWLVGFKIPRMTNCSCAKRFERGQLEIPSSTVNGQIFVSYHLTIKGIRKQKKKEKSVFGGQILRRAKGEERLQVSVRVKRKVPEADPRQVAAMGKCGTECVCVG